MSGKGITPIIAIILLLLITVSMAGFAFIFLQRTIDTVQKDTETELLNTLTTQRQKFAIENTNNSLIYVRHIGTASSNTTLVSVYVNSGAIACTWDIPGTWQPGEVRSCNSALIVCPGSTIEVVGPGNRDATIC